VKKKKRKAPVPVATFAVAVREVNGKGRSVVNVSVWRSRADLRAWGRHYLFISGLRDARAFCHSYARYTPSGRRALDFAELCFVARDLGSEIISHECFHAAFAWARRQRLSDAGLLCGSDEEIEASDVEESICEFAGLLVRAVVLELYELKLIGYSDPD
jgi:hypothetical protein